MLAYLFGLREIHQKHLHADLVFFTFALKNDNLVFSLFLLWLWFRVVDD
jgi:hypothetical protein